MFCPLIARLERHRQLAVRRQRSHLLNSQEWQLDLEVIRIIYPLDSQHEIEILYGRLHSANRVIFCENLELHVGSHSVVRCPEDKSSQKPEPFDR